MGGPKKLDEGRWKKLNRKLNLVARPSGKRATNQSHGKSMLESVVVVQITGRSPKNTWDKTDKLRDEALMIR